MEMYDENLNGPLEALVPNPGLCKRLRSGGWVKSKYFIWFDIETIAGSVYELNEAYFKDFEDRNVIPAPTAEELLQAFYKLYPSVRNVIIAPNKKTKGWMICWFDQADISFSVVANTLANALARAYLRVTKKEKNKHV